MVQKAGSYSFHCTTAGATTLPAVVFLHGFMGSGSDWLPVMNALSQEYYCIAPDLPGHGSTEVHGGGELYSMENTSSGLAELLRELGINSCMLVGYSMGGRIALYLTATGVLPIRATVLESSSPGLRTTEERQARRQHDEGLAHRLETTPFKEFVQRWYEQPLFALLRQHSSFEAVAARRCNNNPEGLALSLRHLGTGTQPSLWDALPSITTPVVVLAGEYDTKFVGIGRDMASLLPNTRLHIAQGAGHTIHVEDELWYREVLRNVLRQYSTAQPISFSQSTD